MADDKLIQAQFNILADKFNVVEQERDTLRAELAVERIARREERGEQQQLGVGASALLRECVTIRAILDKAGVPDGRLQARIATLVAERNVAVRERREERAAVLRECAASLRDKAEQLRKKSQDTGAWEWAARILDRFAEQWERGGSTEGYGPPSDIGRWRGAQATGRFLRDRGGHLLAKCGSSEIAAELATVLAAHAAAGPTPPATGDHVCGLQGFGRGTDSESDICPACREPATDPWYALVITGEASVELLVRGDLALRDAVRKAFYMDGDLPAHLAAEEAARWANIKDPDRWSLAAWEERGEDYVVSIIKITALTGPLRDARDAMEAK